ncbi:TnsA endonuclease N-terminal domain-containing protein [Cupriavidus sp. BIS7]|uniref:TnsA endonuclease N-terminal domain-containing protein n=1 Tax=Cupriavidus sp. BIS7 TaxID=1217718 RepID=UPI0009FE96F9|nr:TnsA endonuclease N-terminal domain-containing protein [Cupriavidus sp. BIS7]
MQLQKVRNRLAKAEAAVQALGAPRRRVATKASKAKVPRFEMTPKKFERFLLEGRGQGEGPTYRPFIQIDDLSSKGVSHRTSSSRTGFRTHHLLSDNEYAAYLAAWFDMNVLDIREQYPMLPVTLTLGIAASLGVKHPMNRKYRFAIPQTADLFLVTKEGVEVVAVKEDEDYENPRTREKLAIAEEFWRLRGIPTRVALASELKTQRFQNLQWIYDARRKQYERPFELGVNPLYDFLLSEVAGREIGLRELANHTDTEFGQPLGTALAAIRRLLAERVLETDINAGDITKDCVLFVNAQWQ